MKSEVKNRLIPFMILGGLVLFTYGCEKEDTNIKNIVFNPDKTYGTVTDINGNEYKTIQIGLQTWMAENLRATNFRNGDFIRTTSPATASIKSEEEPIYQWAYEGDEKYVATYGRLYTWCTAVDVRKICPTGWHVPSRSEAAELQSFLGGGDVGAKLKETGTSHWQSPNNDSTNESGFTALPSGERYGSEFIRLGTYAYFWCSTSYYSQVAQTGMFDNFAITPNNSMSISAGSSYYNGYAIRCIKD